MDTLMVPEPRAPPGPAHLASYPHGPSPRTYADHGRREPGKAAEGDEEHL